MNVDGANVTSPAVKIREITQIKYSHSLRRTAASEIHVFQSRGCVTDVQEMTRFMAEANEGVERMLMRLIGYFVGHGMRVQVYLGAEVLDNITRGKRERSRRMRASRKSTTCAHLFHDVNLLGSWTWRIGRVLFIRNSALESKGHRLCCVRRAR